MLSPDDKKTLLLTRPSLQSNKCAQNIYEVFPDKFHCLISPLLDISLTGQLPELEPFQSVIFTSANGVRSFVEKGGRTRAPCICVGDRTAATARENCLDAYSAKGSSHELIMLAGKVLDPTNGPVLYIRGKQATGNVSQSLENMGFEVEELILYHQNPQKLTRDVAEDFEAANVDLITLYSPMTAALLCETIKENSEWQLGHISVICISRKVEKQLAGLDFGQVRVAHDPLQDAMIGLMGEYLRGQL